MRNLKTLGRYWLPLLAWMGVIFLASADSRSREHSSRMLGPLLHWLFPSITPEAIRAVQVVVAKGAHVVEYAVLGFLLWRMLRRPVKNDRRPWNWPQAGLALLFSCVYGMSDEFHQSFVPTRTASAWDVLIDTCGAAAGLFLLWLWGRWRKRW